MRRIVCVAFEGVQTLDLTGPAEVFACAGRVIGEPVYEVVVTSIGGETCTSSAGMRIGTRDLQRVIPKRDDIVIVAGGEDGPVRAAVADERLLAWIRRASRKVRILGSVCSGAFVLAAAGLLEGRRAATHWSACDRLARAYPRVDVDPNAIFVRDGKVWTSAGVTTGIDMALAIVEEDLGREVANAIAAQLVLYVRRPGFQSQFSEALVAQTSKDDGLGAAIGWARGHLAEADVDSFARKAGVSVRTLHRRCLDTLGTTPARLLDRLRVEHARALLEDRGLSAKELAVAAGFGTTARMNRAFVRELGMTPRTYGAIHTRAS